MRPPLADPPLVEDEDLVHVLHGGEPVGDHDRGPAPQQHAQRVLDELLGLGVHRRGGLVEDQHPRVVGEGAGEREQLLLAHGEGRPRSFTSLS